MNERDRWVDWAVEIQALAQAGLTYGKDPYDLERYTRLREIAAEMIACKADISVEKARDLFCCETGYQTPKVDTRAAVFQDGRQLSGESRNDGEPLFSREELPENLAEEKVTKEQLWMCFDAKDDPNWQPMLD